MYEYMIFMNHFTLKGYDNCHTHNAVSQLGNIRGLDDLDQVTSGISV